MNNSMVSSSSDRLVLPSIGSSPQASPSALGPAKKAQILRIYYGSEERPLVSKSVSSLAAYKNLNGFSKKQFR